MTDSKNKGKNSQGAENGFAVGVRRARGRPKDSLLRERIIEKARDLFLEHGYQAVAMDGIAEAAQVSNRTVYSHFESKERLLASVFQMEGERLRPRFPIAVISSKDEFHAGLQRFGEHFVALLTDPAIIGLGRILIGESGRHPEMAKQFYEWGPQQTEEQLVQFIEQGKEQGLVLIDNSAMAGKHLLALWQGTWHLRQQLGLEKKLTPAKIKRHVAETLRVFFQGVGIKTHNSAVVNEGEME